MNDTKVILRKKEYGYLLEFKNEFDISINEMKNSETTKLKVKSYIDTNGLIVENKTEFDFLGESYAFEGAEPINEMDMFDVDRRDLTTMKDVLKAPDKAHKTVPANKTYFKKRLKDTELTAERSNLHQHPAFDSAYEASGVTKNEKAKKPKV